MVPPEGEHRPERAWDIEEGNLAFAAEPRAMRHRHLGDFETDQASPRQHFRVHEEAARFGHQLHQRLAAKDLERAVAIANASAEQAAGQHVVAPRIESPPVRVLAINPPSGHDGLLRSNSRHRTEVEQIKLAIGIREGNEVESRLFESGSQRRPITTIEAMSNQPGMRGVHLPHQ